MSAFDGLYERHVAVASNVARRNVDNQSDAEDVVAEAFQSVLQSLVSGKGPDTFFRAYLLSTVARLSHQRNRKSGKVLPSSDDSVLDHTLADSDPAISAFESHTVAKAFRSLPERWQAVLWYLDVERMKPAAVAPILGLSANAVSALALRAREGLRRQYLQYHIAEQADDKCLEYVSKLGNYIRGGVSSGTARKIRGHLEGCPSCTAALAELKYVQGSMRAVLLPLITGIPAALWVGKGAGLGVVGGMVPAKAAVALPAFAQPGLMAVLATAAVGLVVGAVSLVDTLTPEAYMEQRAVESTVSPREKDPLDALPAPTATPTPLSTPPADQPVVQSPAEEQPVEGPTANVPPAEVKPEPEGSAVQPSTPTPGSVPATTPSAVPSVVPPASAPAVVKGSASHGGETSFSGTVVDVDFRVAGASPLSTGKAVFSVGKNSYIVEGSIRAPDGWSCSFESRSVVSCTTNSVQRTDLRFQLGTNSKRGRDVQGKDERVLTYSLSGPGLASKKFSAVY